MSAHEKRRPAVRGRGNLTYLQTPTPVEDVPHDFRVVVGDLSSEGLAEVTAMLQRHGYLYEIQRRT